MKLMIKVGSRYRLAPPHLIREAAAQYALHDLNRMRPSFSNPNDVRPHLIGLLGNRSYETFCVAFLDNRHQLIEFVELFRGTIDGASVHPREVVRECLARNGAAVIFVHNHPSGVAEPSQADELITRRLKDALALIDVRVLDHFIVAGNHFLSFAQRGLI